MKLLFGIFFVFIYVPSIGQLTDTISILKNEMNLMSQYNNSGCTKIYFKVDEADTIAYVEEFDIECENITEQYSGIFVNGRIVKNGIYSLQCEGGINEFGSYLLGDKVGNWIVMKNDSMLVESTFFRNDVPDGEYFKYYPSSGQVNVAGGYINGLKTGTWCFFYENGILSDSGKYSIRTISGAGEDNFEKWSRKHKDWEGDDSQNFIEVKNGSWFHYNQKGRLRRIDVFQLGIRVKAKIYL